MGDEREKGVKDLYLKDVENNLFFDGSNRIADFICGGLADFNYSDGSVTGKKQCTILEDIISDNLYLTIFDTNANGVARITHNKI